MFTSAEEIREAEALAPISEGRQAADGTQPCGCAVGFTGGIREKEPIAFALMVSFLVIMRAELNQGPGQGALPKTESTFPPTWNGHIRAVSRAYRLLIWRRTARS
jgi:hypothetical protein